jgi:hypothetical protein
MALGLAPRRAVGGKGDEPATPRLDMQSVRPDDVGNLSTPFPARNFIMASGKKRRKETRLDRKARQPPTGTFRHRDGDRRRRGGITADQGLAEKKARLQGLIPPLPPEPEGG